LKIKVKIYSTSRPAETVIAGPIAQAAQKAYTDTWEHEPNMERAGGSVPIIGMFQHVLGVPAVSLGLGHGSNVHSPNEYYDLDYFDKNIKTAIHFYFNMAKVK
jgi:acetylornithine deacetylase/succinyl-diaminopimelate desuccinylase-like protein